MPDVPTPRATPPDRTPVSGETEGAHDVSLLLGGPFFQLLLRAGLIRPTFDLLVRRIVVLALLAWAPLLVLTLLAGTALGGHVKVPFLLDVEAYARFLVAIPLLVLAEREIHLRLRPLFSQFLERELLAPADVGSFDAILASARRWRNSYAAEALMVVVAFGMTPLLWRPHIVLDVGTWYARPTGGDLELSPAGWWYGYAAIPLMRFLLLRWIYRLVLLYVGLGRIARLPLRLVPTHPDGAGGLAFLEQLGVSLRTFQMAVTSVVSGYIGGQILFGGRTLADFYVLGGVVLGVLAVLTLLPVLFFAGPLVAARRRGLREYGALAQRYVFAFEQKWVRPGTGAAPARELLGSADVQSLADLSTGFAAVRGMRTIPVGLRELAALVVGAALPLAPLLLTTFSLEAIVQQLIQLVL